MIRKKINDDLFSELENSKNLIQILNKEIIKEKSKASEEKEIKIFFKKEKSV